MVKMATENEFAGLKLYAFFHLEAVDEEPKFFDFWSFNSQQQRQQTQAPQTIWHAMGCWHGTERNGDGRCQTTPSQFP
jgi:hypothetical protein